MRLIDKIKEFIMGKKYDRTDLDHHYSNSPYKRAKAYYTQNRSISGTEAVMQKITEARQRYLTEMEQYIAQERPREEAHFSKIQKMGTKKQLFKWFFFGTVFVIYILGKLHVSPRSQLLWFLWDLFCTALVLFAIAALLVMLVYKCRESFAENAYQRYLKEIQSGFDRINFPHNETMNALYTEIDDLYLASLDPTHREIILMRRDQARQHEEAMKMQKETLHAQKEHQKAVEAEQRRTRAAQEELLVIERERERRYRGY